jgi:hypothetical protein
MLIGCKFKPGPQLCKAAEQCATYNIETPISGEISYCTLLPVPRRHWFLSLTAKEREGTRIKEEKKKIPMRLSKKRAGVVPQITNNIQYTNSKSQTIHNTHMNNGLIPVPDFEVTFTSKPLETNFYIERDLKSSLDLFGILVIGILNLLVIWDLEFVILLSLLPALHLRVPSRAFAVNSTVTMNKKVK